METTAITWSTAISGWLASQRAAGHSERTLTLRRRYLMRLSGAPGMPALLEDVTTEHLVAFLERHRWAAETRYSVQSTIRGLFGWLVRKGYIPANPADELLKIKRTPPNPRPFPEREFLDVLARCDERRLLMVQLGAGLGMRCIEISRVHTRDVLPTTHGYSLTVHGKGDKVRIVPMPDDLARAVLDAGGWLFPGRGCTSTSPRASSRSAPVAEPLVIICTPTTTPVAQVVAGSTVSRCSRCRRHVWIAPSSLEDLVRCDPVPALVCFTCIVRDEGPGFIRGVAARGPTPAQADELADWRRRRPKEEP